MKNNKIVCKLSTVWIAISLLMYSCKKTDSAPTMEIPEEVGTPSPPPPDGELVFKNGFEGSTEIYGTSTWKDDLRGNDGASSPKSDWITNLATNNPFCSQFFINYEMGTNAQRKASIVTDPLNSSNRALVTELTEANVYLTPEQFPPDGQYKGRVQLEVNNRKETPAGGFPKEYYQKERIYLSPDFIHLINSNAPEKFGWLILMEYRNNPSWDAVKDRQFRISVRVEKKIRQKAGEKLHFVVDAQTLEANGWKHPANWEVFNDNFEIPIGKWMTVEVYMKEGNSGTGRFYMAVTVDNVKTVIVDKTGLTHHDAPNYIADGFNCFSPIKMYCSKGVVDAFKNNGKTMRIYWDDLELWTNRRP